MSTSLQTASTHFHFFLSTIGRRCCEPTSEGRQIEPEASLAGARPRSISPAPKRCAGPFPFCRPAF